MRNEVLRHDAELAAARTREPVLAAFPSVSALVAALPMTEAQSHAEKHALTSALLHEHARTRSTLWASLLVIAFEPMLVAQCGRATSLPPGEREQTVLAAFLESVRAGAAHEYLRSAPGYLKASTQMNVVHDLTCRQASREDDAEVTSYDDDRTPTETRDIFESPVERLAVAREDHALKARAAEIEARVAPAELRSPDRNIRRRARRTVIRAKRKTRHQRQRGLVTGASTRAL